MKKRGPAKGKTQYTIRIDADLMKRVRAQLRGDGMRLTDVIEQGLILALEEKGHPLPYWPGQPLRFLLRNPARADARAIHGLAVAMVEGQVRKRSDEEEELWRFLERFLLRRADSPHADECLKRYVEAR